MGAIRTLSFPHSTLMNHDGVRCLHRKSGATQSRPEEQSVAGLWNLTAAIRQAEDSSRLGHLLSRLTNHCKRRRSEFRQIEVVKAARARSFASLFQMKKRIKNIARCQGVGREERRRRFRSRRLRSTARRVSS